MISKPTLHCHCKGQFLEKMYEYDAPPPGETIFDLRGQEYKRAYERCRLCGHWFADNQMDMSGLYDGEYAATTYGDKMLETFQRIISLPPDQSDNTARIKRIQDFSLSHFKKDRKIRLLDVGAGLGVFPHAVKRIGWHCTAIDPDSRAVEHMRNNVGVEAVCGDFMQVSGLDKYEIITFNKVLEHVYDPVAMLAKSKEFLSPGGFIYVEVPDGESASKEGKDREEFFIEHHHVFSMVSTVFLVEQSGFVALAVERIQEPSSKFTIKVFIISN
jgi:2-polyprenyl-3-methyl-5-hydroxy-6-metoxy-1,4-benzoquinol methylase